MEVVSSSEMAGVTQCHLVPLEQAQATTATSVSSAAVEASVHRPAPVRPKVLKFLYPLLQVPLAILYRVRMTVMTLSAASPAVLDTVHLMPAEVLRAPVLGLAGVLVKVSFIYHLLSGTRAHTL